MLCIKVFPIVLIKNDLIRARNINVILIIETKQN